MSLFDTVRIALRALMKNKMRAVLTVIGVVIGIAAVTTIVSIGEGAHRLVQGEFETLGTNVVFVTPGQTERDGVRQGGGADIDVRGFEGDRCRMYGRPCVISDRWDRRSSHLRQRELEPPRNAGRGAGLLGGP